MTLTEWYLGVSVFANCALGYKIYTTRKTIKEVITLTSELENLSEATSIDIKKLKTTAGEK